MSAFTIFKQHMGKVTKIVLSLVASICVMATMAIFSASINAVTAENKIPFSTEYGYLQQNDLPSFETLFGKNFHFKKDDGKTFGFKELTDQVTVIAFSTTWCHNCPTVLKALETLQTKITQQKINNIKIIALNVGDDELFELKSHYKKYDIESLDVYESIESVDSSYIRGVPTCLVFAPSGNPVCGYVGWHDFASDEFIEFLKRLQNKAKID